jgi:hypothetical protein
VTFIERLTLPLHTGRFWLLFNAVGMGAYLAIESWMSFYCEKEALNGFDQTFLWVTTEFPLLSLYLGANVTWLLMSRKSDYFKTRHLSIWLFVCLVWGVVLLCDPVAIKIAELITAMVNGTAWNHQ